MACIFLLFRVEKGDVFNAQERPPVSPVLPPPRRARRARREVSKNRSLNN